MDAKPVPEVPVAICDECRNELAGHWLSDVFGFCGHSRTIIFRHHNETEWRVVKNARPEQVAAAITNAQAFVRKIAAQTGETSSTIDAWLQANSDRERNKRNSD